MMDIEMLEKKGEATCHKESIVAVERQKDYKIGIGMRINKKEVKKFFVAIQVSLGINEDCSIDIGSLERRVRALRLLDSNGYTLCYGGNGSIYCELKIEREKLQKKVEELQILLSAYLGEEAVDS